METAAILKMLKFSYI